MFRGIKIALLCVICGRLGPLHGLRSPRSPGHLNPSRLGRLVKSMSSFADDKESKLGLGDIGGQEDDDDGTMPKKGETESWYDRILVSSAKARKIRGGNYVQIATVNEDGQPCCRTVVFRGFLTLSSPALGVDTLGSAKYVAMKMITDARSDKVTQILNNPSCEMVWWFSKSSEQYRISGTLKLIGGDTSDEELDNARKQQWGNLSDQAREQFFWNEPGIYSGEPTVPAGGRNEEGNVLPPPSTFNLLLLVPERVKYLRLTDNYAQVDEFVGIESESLFLESSEDYNYAKQWKSTRINP
jgi:pyridoxamine 5'-phosphate oxidase